MYILTEQILNGTVTMEIISTGVEADSFEEAKNKVKNMSNIGKAVIQEDSDNVIAYLLNQQFPCFGRMKNKTLNVI